MPAQRSYVVVEALNGTDVLRFSVEGDLESGRSVYFTDQSPVFTVTVENLTEKRVELDNWARLIFDESDSAHESGEQISCTLGPKETDSFDFELDMLSHQGNAAIGVHTMSASEDDDQYSTRKNNNRMKRLYTFMVYDREYYKLNYLRPRRAQYAAAILTVGIVLFSAASYFYSIGWI
ncbi:hypothetical protein [Halorubrum aethiopicum]|uniref:hypothetical protein n=1 Tax=Halorubrum aethiopicum TaxID=1758255 RepID=UPI00082F3711|nr:hypothetical protein [Halorubrum aethiopicum]